MMTNPKTYAVLGLGPSGLAAVKELVQQHATKGQKVQVVGFDPSPRVGGKWAIIPRKDDSSSWSTASEVSGVWKEMCMNDPRHYIEFSDFPWRKEDYNSKRDGTKGPLADDLFGVFAHHTEAQLYLEAYAKHFGLNHHFRLNTKVVKVERAPGISSNTGWLVYYQGTQSRRIDSAHFDVVVDCRGRYNVPKNPLVSWTRDGSAVLDNFTGKVLHSCDFDGVASFDGLRVLVVGHMASSSDIACALAKAENTKRLVNVVRRIPMHMNRLSRVNKKIGYDAGMAGNRFITYLNRTLPMSLNMQGMQKKNLDIFPEQITAELSGDAQIARDPDILVSGATYAVDYMEHYKAGRIVLKKNIVSVHGKQVTFEVGASEEFDVIICGTGYHCDFSVVPEQVQNQVRFSSHTGTEQAALYLYTLVPDICDYVFVGQHAGFGPNWPALEMAARYVAAIFSGRIPRPCESTIRRGATAFQHYRTGGPEFIRQYDLSLVVQELLAEQLGVAPSAWRALFWEPSKLLFSYPYSSYYRIHDDNPDVARQARVRWEELLAQHGKYYPADEL